MKIKPVKVLKRTFSPINPIHSLLVCSWMLSPVPFIGADLTAAVLPDSSLCYLSFWLLFLLSVHVVSMPVSCTNEDLSVLIISHLFEVQSKNFSKASCIMFPLGRYGMMPLVKRMKRVFGKTSCETPWHSSTFFPQRPSNDIWLFSCYIKNPLCPTFKIFYKLVTTTNMYYFFHSNVIIFVTVTVISTHYYIENSNSGKYISLQ